MDTKAAALALLCTALVVRAQSYDAGVLHAPGDFSEDRPGGLARESSLEREFAGGFPGGYRDRGPRRYPDSVSGNYPGSGSYPGRRPARLPSRDVYPGGFPGGTSPTLCGGRVCPIGSRCVTQRTSCVRKPCYPVKTCVS